MHEFSAFVYLDVQKTGSTFVNEFLSSQVKEPAIQFRRHKPVVDHDPGKFYFITCRDPLQQYLSLYSWGHEGRGRFRRTLGPEMYDGTAEGFSKWLRFAMDERNTEASKEMRKYGASGIAPYVGYQTFRFLNLSFAAPEQVMAECRSADDVRQAFRAKRIWNEALHNENLITELKSLIDRVLGPYLTDVAAALAWLDSGEQHTVSTRVDKVDGFTILDEDKRLIEEREWLLFEEMGYKRYTAA